MSAPRAAQSGRIRIIAGSLRNSRLHVPDLPGLRPTSERVRETLFNWLAPTIQGMRCLDLCAGTGALGIEALSRGAASVQFVEREARAAQALRQNLQRLGLDAAGVAVVDAQRFLDGSPQPVDLVFLDPPFALALWGPLAERLEHGGWLAKTASIYVECPHAAVASLPPSWQRYKEARAGAVHFALYRRQPVPDAPSEPTPGGLG